MRLAPAIVLVGLLLAPPLAHARGPAPTEITGLPRPYDLVTGRFPRTPGAQPATLPAATTPWEQLAFRIRFGGAALDPAAYVALGELHAAGGEADLAWWAYMRAIELGAPEAAALRDRCAALEAAWKQQGRPDPPTEAQFRFAREGNERWVAAFDKNAQQALRDHEDLTAPKVLHRLGEEADLEVPPVILGADSFMRRWGVALLVLAAMTLFGALYGVAALRRRGDGLA